MTSPVGMNTFALRQTAASEFSHFEGSTTELLELVNAAFDPETNRVIAKDEETGEPRVIGVTVPSGRFFSGVIQVTPETELFTEFKARREGEEPYIRNVAKGRKARAVVTEVICYSHAALAEDGDASTWAEFEVVSIGARDTVDPEPQHPVSWARNVLGLEGGTKRVATPEEIKCAEMIMYWSTRASVKV